MGSDGGEVYGNKRAIMESLTISIVTYNNQDEILGVLQSISDSVLQSKVTVNIVDNNSTDNTVNLVRDKFPDYVVLEMAKNLGYGAGHNQAIRHVKSTYHAIINPDITFEKNVLAKLITYMNNNPDVVLCGPKILNIDGTEQYLPKKQPKLKYLIGGFLETKGSVFKRWRTEYTLSDIEITEPIEIDFCSGCFMFARTSALQRCNGFDERYFMYFEDGDLTRELKEYGKTVFNPFVEVVHEWKRENKALKGRMLQIFSMLKYFRKWGFHD